MNDELRELCDRVGRELAPQSAVKISWAEWTRVEDRGYLETHGWGFDGSHIWEWIEKPVEVARYRWPYLESIVPAEEANQITPLRSMIDALVAELHSVTPDVDLLVDSSTVGEELKRWEFNLERRFWHYPATAILGPTDEYLTYRNSIRSILAGLKAHGPCWVLRKRRSTMSAAEHLRSVFHMPAESDWLDCIWSNAEYMQSWLETQPTVRQRYEDVLITDTALRRWLHRKAQNHCMLRANDYVFSSPYRRHHEFHASELLRILQE